MICQIKNPDKLKNRNLPPFEYKVFLDCPHSVCSIKDYKYFLFIGKIPWLLV